MPNAASTKNFTEASLPIKTRSPIRFGWDFLINHRRDLSHFCFTKTQFSFRPQSEELRQKRKGFSHGLTKCPPDTSLHQCLHWYRPFKSPHQKKEAHPYGCASFFWRSRRDLNPRYPFGVHTISSRARYDHFDTAPWVRHSCRLAYITTKTLFCQALFLHFFTRFCGMYDTVMNRHE